jgi:hypothetical protein
LSEHEEENKCSTRRGTGSGTWGRAGSGARRRTGSTTRCLVRSTARRRAGTAGWSGDRGDQISLFKPATISIKKDKGEENAKSPVIMKRGAIIVATTESHVIPRNINYGLAACVQRESSNEKVPMYYFEVLRLSRVEVEHMLANYESIGLGKLRLDQGDTVMNGQEVTFLRMVSGGVCHERSAAQLHVGVCEVGRYRCSF